MSIAEQLKLIRDELAEWAKTRGGSVSIATDPVNLFSMLVLKPGSVRCGVLFQLEEAVGEAPESGRVDRTYVVAVSRGRSLRLDPGSELVEPSAGGPAICDLVEEVRQVLRGIEFEDDGYAEFRRIAPFEVQGYMLDAYNIEIKIGSQLPEVDGEEQ